MQLATPPPFPASWPSREPQDVGVDGGRLQRLVDFALAHASHPYRGDAPDRVKEEVLRRVLGREADVRIIGPLTRPGSVNGLVVRHGYLVAEFGDTSYADEIASATKSFLSMLGGIAVDEGLIESVHNSVFDDTGLDLLADDHNRRIAWHHLLQQTSEWDGELFGKRPTGHRGERIGEAPHEPGTYWEYNDVRVNLLARALLEAFRRPLPAVLADRVMRPIGASTTWEWHGYSTSRVIVDDQLVESVSGGAHWGGGVWMNSQDLARVGLLYLRGGVWGDRRLLSSRWIERTRTPCDLNPMYGYMWWLQHDRDGRQVSFAAQGGGSHQCFVIPDHDLVIAVKWIADDAWMEFLNLALDIVTDRPALGPVRYMFDRINRQAG